MVEIGLIFPPDQPPERLRAVAEAAEAAGVPELWLWEDCFAESGVAPAAAALAWSSRLRVGLGLLPVPLRNVALTAMELSTLDRMFPGRLLPGIGHGVLPWMGQAGARASSPLTLLREYGVALRALLSGEEVTSAGRYVTLDRVRLRHAPLPAAQRAPLLVGAEGPKTLALAGEIGDGVIFTGGTTPGMLRSGLDLAYAARHAAGLTTPLDVVVFHAVPADAHGVRIAAEVTASARRGRPGCRSCCSGPMGPRTRARGSSASQKRWGRPPVRRWIPGGRERRQVVDETPARRRGSRPSMPSLSANDPERRVVRIANIPGQPRLGDDVSRSTPISTRTSGACTRSPREALRNSASSPTPAPPSPPRRGRRRSSSDDPSRSVNVPTK